MVREDLLEPVERAVVSAGPDGLTREELADMFDIKPYEVDYIGQRLWLDGRGIIQSCCGPPGRRWLYQPTRRTPPPR